MKHPFQNVRWYVLLLGLATALSILGVLQYRSARQLSRSTSQQMHATLSAALMEFRRELEIELAPITRDLRLSPENRRQDDLQQLAGGFAEWQRTAAHPALVTKVLVWRYARRAGSEVLRLEPARGEFVPDLWPAQLLPFEAELERMSTNPREGPNGRGEHFPPPPRPPDFHRPPSWWIDQHVPALVGMDVPEGAGSTPRGPPPEPIWVIVLLDQEVLVKQVFAELVDRVFSGNGLDYRIRIVDGTEGQPIYSSEAGLPGTEAKFAPDASLNLFGPPIVSSLPLSRSALVALPGPPHGERGDPFMLLRYSPDEQGWLVVAQHRKGSLEAAVASIFYRNLAINFGVLLVLALTTGLIIVTSARARRLAQLQVDFVAGVSHELRTPLTGIVAAAENLEDGLVDGKDQLMRYGSAILNQAHQLSDLIEQILMFSAVEKGRQRYHLQPTDVAQVVDSSLQNTASLIQSAGIRVERAIEPDLPPVNADFQALSRCLENLITNAIKYGGEKRWIGVRAFVRASSEHEREIRISVEDHGIGIDSRDLKEIFEPFYRSPSVTAAEIHGNGLGLPLAARIAEAMGGRLSVESVPGRGSSFTVHIPVQEAKADGPDVATAAGVNYARDGSIDG